MKKIMYLIVTSITWYLAAMYRSVPLMALTLTELVLFVSMWLLSFYLKYCIRAGFEREMLVCRKGEEPSGNILVENRGIFPAGVVRLRLRICDPDRKKKTSISLFAGSGKRISRKITFPIEKPHCGLLLFKREKLYVYDYLTLFRRKKKQQEELKIAVLPAKRHLRLFLASDPWQEMQLSGQDDHGRPGANMDEIRQLREHVRGEPYRFIHWKQSARLDKLLIKEYYQSEEESFALSVCPGSWKNKTAVEKDAFYEVLSALLLGILDRGRGVKVFFEKKDGSVAVRTLWREQDCDEFLIFLYREEEEAAAMPSVPGPGLCLDGGLRLTFFGKEICQFTADHFEKELDTFDVTVL